jgi:hypothetical protein
MASRMTLDDLQQIIDVQFGKLTSATTGAEINQLVHGLRIHLRQKDRLGGRLTERERQIYDHREQGAPRSSLLPRLLGSLLILAGLAALAWWLWRTFGGALTR